jgi:hypothetical protein
MFTFDQQDNNSQEVIKKLEMVREIPSQENVQEFKFTGIAAKLFNAIRAVTLRDDDEDLILDCVIAHANNIYFTYKNIETFLFQTHQSDPNEDEKTIRRLFIEIVDDCKKEAGDRLKN